MQQLAHSILISRLPAGARGSPSQDKVSHTVDTIYAKVIIPCIYHVYTYGRLYTIYTIYIYIKILYVYRIVMGVNNDLY